MELIAQGRDCDVFACGPGLVLRRHRDGRSAEPEATKLRSLGQLGYPVPRVRRFDGPDLVMDRVDGPTLATSLQTGDMEPRDAARLLANLHDHLHALPWPGAADGEALLHLDLHPLNILLGASGPVVIDWANARPGPPGLDVALAALILAQLQVTPGMLPEDPALEEALRPLLDELLETYATCVSTPYADHLDDAIALREQDISQSTVELRLLPRAAERARAVADRATDPPAPAGAYPPAPPR